MIYKVTLWPEVGPAKTVEVEADNHHAALDKSGLVAPGAIVSVDGCAQLNIRYQVDSAGRARKLAQYGSNID